MVLVAALIPTVILGASGWHLGSTAAFEVDRQVNATLDVALQLEKSLIDSTLAQLQHTALGLAAAPEVQAALQGKGDPAPALARVRTLLPRADIVAVVDAAGRVVRRAGSPAAGDRISYGGLVERVLLDRRPLAVPAVIPEQELAGEAEELRAQVRIPILPTRGAQDRRVGSVLGDALALVGAAPVVAPGGVLGVVVVADVLNNDYAIVDEVKVRAPADLPLYATIALDGVRVATNVPAPDGRQRATGTLYSDPVVANLRQGLEYRGPALVGGWQRQRTIYIPLRDHTGRVIGGPFVGIPEEAIGAVRDLAQYHVALIPLALAAAVWAALALGYRTVVAPLARLVQGLAALAQKLVEGVRQAQAAAAGALAAGGPALVGAVAAGAQDQALAMAHGAEALAQVAERLKATRAELAAARAACQQALAAAQGARTQALRTAAALEWATVASGSAAAGGEGPGGAAAQWQPAGEEARAWAAAAHQAVATAALRVQEALDHLWGMGAALNEAAARAGAACQQMQDLAAQAAAAAASLAELQAALQALAARWAGWSGEAPSVEEGLHQARRHLDQVAAAQEQVAGLAGQVQALAAHLT